MSRRSFRRPASYLGLLALLAVGGCRQATQTPTRPGSNGSSRPSIPALVGGSSNEGHLFLGNPSNATANPNTSANNYLVQKPQYTLSYNKSKGGPNWVSWHTDSSDLGDTDRGKFRPDPQLPKAWQITPNDYKNSGYDRGHVCPSGDRTSSRDNNDATFYMSNMLPQTPELNQHVWADLENYLREQIRAGNEVYEFAGPAGAAGTIAGGKVAVPRMCWKIAVILPEGSNDWTRINAKTRVIAVAIPNANDKKLETADWRSYIVSPRKIQDATRLAFFTSLPLKVKSALDQKVDSGN